MKTPIRTFFSVVVGMAAAFSIAGCAPSAPQLKKVMEENPDILYSVIQKDPRKFLEVVNEAAQQARQQEEQRFAEEENKTRDEEFNNPKVPEITEGRAFTGAKDAPVTIVEYSDFQCPFCKRGHNTMEQVIKEYPGKVRVVFKNFPIERIHPQALPASKMYEAISLQDIEKANKFKALVFDNQERLGPEGMKLIEDLAKRVGANVNKAKQDMESEEVLRRVASDRGEAEKFGFSGTPGYLVNGVSLKGAYPLPDFKELIDRHLAKAK